MGEVVTNTLTSGQTLTTIYSADFGDIIIAGLLLGLVVVLAIEFMYTLVYR